MSWKILKKAARAIPTPFELQLHEQEEPLICEKVIRIIPRKRIVVFGTWKNQFVVAKLFFERSKAKKHSKRDVTGINALSAVNIPTPALLFDGTDKAKRIHVLIFERILDCCNLDVLWQEKGDLEELTPLMRAVTIEIATQHVLGIVQRDLHLKNFLVTSKTIYTLDGGSIEQFDGPLSKKESLDHLGLFFAQLGVGSDKLQQELFNLYTQSRGWIVRPADLDLLKQSTKKWIALRRERYQKKIQRSCSAFARVEKLNAIIMYDRDYLSDQFNQMLANPDAFIAKSDTKILKAGRSSTVAKLELDNRTFIIKRYNIKNFWHWLRRCFRPSRAYHSWRLSHLLRHVGIPTAKPVAFIEKSFLTLRNKSYFIMEYIDGKHIGEYFSQYQTTDPKFSQMAKRVLNLFSNLAELRMTHGDLKMTNILIDHDRPTFIDLDGMQTHQNTREFLKAYNKEMQRFMKNWETQPRIRELFRDAAL
jgi:tRNA A-37 threonylcarbamoyl transferase component Bud32